MILYTPLSITDIFPSEEQPRSELISSNGKQVLARGLADGSYQIEQLVSTDPQDFLNGGLAPGMIVKG